MEAKTCSTCKQTRRNNETPQISKNHCPACGVRVRKVVADVFVTVVIDPRGYTRREQIGEVVR